MAKLYWRIKVTQQYEELSQVLKQLADTVALRKEAVHGGNNTENSYVASLFKKGDDAILKKIGEESAETIMAAKDARNLNSQDATQSLINEVADLWFHSIVLLAQFNCRPEDVMAELKRREGISGIAEKASRPQ